MLSSQFHKINTNTCPVKKQLYSKITTASTLTAFKSMLQKLVLKAKEKS